MLFTRSDNAHSEWGSPSPGTYTEAPTISWSFQLDDPDVSILFATDDSVVVSEKPSSTESARQKQSTITAINLETGSVSWHIDSSNALCDAGAAITYAPGSQLVACFNDSLDDLTLYSAEDGRKLSTLSLSGNRVRVHVDGDTFYSCSAENRAAFVRRGDAEDVASLFEVTIQSPQSIACDLSFYGPYIAATSVSDNWMTVMNEDGKVQYQTYSENGRFRGSELLETTQSDDFDNKNYPTRVVDVDGNPVFEYRNPITNVMYSPGRGLASIFIDNAQTVRSRETGSKLWSYSGNMDNPRPLGQTGKNLIMVEGSNYLKAYDVETGEPIWFHRPDEFEANGRSAGDQPDSRFMADGPRRSFAGDGTYAVVATGKSVVGIDASTGEITWTRESSGLIGMQHQNYLLLNDGNELTALKFR